MITTTHFEEAWAQRDWAQVLEIGQALVAQGELGDPPGLLAYRMEIAAGILGHRFEATFWSEAGLRVVERGSLLHARMLANGMYTRRLYGAPNRALELTAEYDTHYVAYPAEGQALRAWVLYHAGRAHEDRGELEQAIATYREALQEAVDQADEALAGMIRVDLALVYLDQGGTDGADTAEAIMQEVDPSLLSGRGQFACEAVQAEIAHVRQRYQDSLQGINRARKLAEGVTEPLSLELAQLQFLEARNHKALGDGCQALIDGLEAARKLAAVNHRRALSLCEAFLRTALEK